MAPYEAILRVGLEGFQVLKLNSFADPSTNWMQNYSTSSQANVFPTSVPTYIPRIVPNMAP